MKLDNRLQRLLDSKKVPHLMIFHGSTFSLKKQMATLFTQELLQSREEYHPDLHNFFPEGKLGLHSVQSMKQMCQDIFLTSYLGGYQCFVIHEAERMLPASSHSLLKTFEEPPKNTIIILLSTIYSKLLPTIISRSQVFYFSESEAHQASYKEKVFSILTGQSSFDEIENLASKLEKEKEDWEKKNSKELSDDFTAKQKQKYKQEFEGQAAVIFQEHLREIFLAIQEFYRDLWFLPFIDPSQLFYPQFQDIYRHLQAIPLEQVQQWIEEAELAIERGVKLSLCFEILFMRLLCIV